MKNNWGNFIESVRSNYRLASKLRSLATFHPFGLSVFEGYLLSEINTMFKYALAYLSLTFLERKKIDFNQLLIDVVHSLGEEIRRNYFHDSLGFWFTHIMVDEVQDTSAMQLFLLKQIIEYCFSIEVS